MHSTHNVFPKLQYLSQAKTLKNTELSAVACSFGFETMSHLKQNLSFKITVGHCTKQECCIHASLLCDYV